GDEPRGVAGPPAERLSDLLNEPTILGVGDEIARIDGMRARRGWVRPPRVVLTGRETDRRRIAVHDDPVGVPDDDGLRRVPHHGPEGAVAVKGPRRAASRGGRPVT